MEYSTEYILREAIENIANPIEYLRKEAEKEGGKLDGMYAVYMAKDGNWLQEMARKALVKVQEIETKRKETADKEAKGWEDQREAMYNAWKKKEDEKNS